MKFNGDQIKGFAKSYFEQQLKKLPSEFKPGNKDILKGLKGNWYISGIVSPESVLKSIDSKILQLRFDLVSENHQAVIGELPACRWFQKGADERLSFFVVDAD